MPLPDLVELKPLSAPVRAAITVPGSKSITNRALILAALASGTTTLRGALWSEDTQVMVDCLRTLGFKVEVQPDPQEMANRSIVVHGQAGRVPPGGTLEHPLELFVGNAGTAARFLTALVCLGQGRYRLRGVPRMHERPQAALFDALRQLGYTIDSPNDRLPAMIHGTGPRSAACKVSVAQSSQFASALMLCSPVGGWQVNVIDESTDESPYITMTRQLGAQFPAGGGEFQIEPDASSGSYFWAADMILKTTPRHLKPEPKANTAIPSILVNHWPTSGWQVDAAFPKFWPLPDTVSRQSDLGDSIMTAIVLAPFSSHPVRFTHLGRLRLQECERVIALRTELTRCGAKVIEQDDVLEVHPGNLHGATIDTYNDHRVAMSFAILGLHVAGIKIKHPACVKKTFPNFFQKLAAAPPAGLGVRITDGATEQPLSELDLFAD